MLQIEAFRLPEEHLYRDYIAQHPGFTKLRALLPDWWMEDSEAEAASVTDLLTNLRRAGVRITHTSRPDLITAIDEMFAMFGITTPYEIYATRSPDAGIENAGVRHVADRMLIEFTNEFLGRMTPDQVKCTVGHELGHFLFDHPLNRDLTIGLALWNAVSTGQGGIDDDILAQISNDPDVLHVFRLWHVLSQLQELSADRIGLLLSRNLEADVVTMIKLTAGYIGENFSYCVEDYLQQAEPVTTDDAWVFETHPFSPQRCRALHAFSQSQLYQEATGAAPGTGTPIADFSRILGEIVPLIGKDTPAPDSATEALLDDYTRQSLLLRFIANADSKGRAAEYHLIWKYVPFPHRDEVQARVDRLLTAYETDPAVTDPYLDQAAAQDSAWKTAMLMRWIEVVKVDGVQAPEELTTIAELAKRIAARAECKRLFTAEFGHDPYARKAASGDQPPRRRRGHLATAGAQPAAADAAQ